MSNLAFVSPAQARPENGFVPRAASQLARALAGAEGIRDVSLLRKLEVRGPIAAIDVEADVIPITPDRSLIVCDDADGAAALPERVSDNVVDVTAAFAGIEVEGETLLRRLTDLALDRLPAAGKVADVPALVRRDGVRFQIFFPQEYGDHVVATVRDAQEGVR
jgi:hypothetical protein